MKKTELFLIAFVTFAFVMAAACGGSKKHSEASRDAAPSGGEKRDAPAGDKNALAANDGGVTLPEPEAPVITDEQRQAYQEHMKKGRELAGQSRFGEAAKEFEAALAAIPMDGRALSELGWAAFRAGDYDKALQANRDSVRVAINYHVKAASLYNLGRIAEAQKDYARASARYEESLRHRPNDVVKKQLRALWKAKPSIASAPTAVPCAKAEAKADALCGCLTKRHQDAEPRFNATCKLLDTGVPEARVAEVNYDYGVYHHYIVHRGAPGWSTIGSLGEFYEGGARGSAHEFSVERAEQWSVEGAELLRVFVKRSGYEHDIAVDETISYATQELTICVLKFGDKEQASCPLRVPAHHVAMRERLGMLEDSDISEAMRKEMTKDLPVRKERRLDVRIKNDGTASVVLGEGEANEVSGFLGSHTLWKTKP